MGIYIMHNNHNNIKLIVKIIMKYINKFSTNADYQAFTEGGGYVTPNICYVTELKGLKFKPKVNNGGVTNLITFSIKNSNSGYIKNYTAKEGMTWREFINSSYNDGCVIIKDGRICFDINDYQNIGYEDKITGAFFDDIITPNYNYVTEGGSHVGGGSD